MQRKRERCMSTFKDTLFNSFFPFLSFARSDSFMKICTDFIFVWRADEFFYGNLRGE